jgi:hypothetical protein
MLVYGEHHRAAQDVSRVAEAGTLPICVRSVAPLRLEPHASNSQHRCSRSLLLPSVSAPDKMSGYAAAQSPRVKGGPIPGRRGGAKTGHWQRAA